MKHYIIAALTASTLIAFTAGPAYAISATYRTQLERSGCNMTNESKGCDIHKTRAENEAAGFSDRGVTPTTRADIKKYDGDYVARHPNGQRVANFHIGAGTVRISGKSVKYTLSGDMLIINGSKTLTYVIYPNKGSFWEDTDSGNRGPIERVYF